MAGRGIAIGVNGAVSRCLSCDTARPDDTSYEANEDDSRLIKPFITTPAHTMGIRRSQDRGTEGGYHVAGRAAIVLCQHVLLWTALYIAASTIYTLVVGAISVNDIPSVVLLLVSSIVSIFYVALHNITTKLRTTTRNIKECERADILRSLAIFTLRVLATLWLVAATLSITITVSRQALCELHATSSHIMPLDKGTTCILNRTAILSSFVSLITSGLLFLLLKRVNEPFRCHLFGIIAEHRLLPLFLPYHKPAMRSEMSFKCRSSTSVEAEAVPARSCSANLSRKTSATLLPPNPNNALGLGIYTSRTALPPPRKPSAAIIRPHTSTYLAPPAPSSPLPPLPVYIPYRSPAPNPPQRPPRPARTRSFMVKPLSLHREDSASSMYSRSTSGGSLPSLSESGRTLSPSSSTSSLGGTPLKAMTVAESEQRLSSWVVDDVEALEKGLLEGTIPRFRARIGVVEGWEKGRWVESPGLEAGRGRWAESPELEVGRERRVLRKARESGREHGMF